jgi:hypothetical protein
LSGHCQPHRSDWCGPGSGIRKAISKKVAMMQINKIVWCILLGAHVAVTLSCTGKRNSTRKRIDHITQLPELKQAEARIDSLNKAGIDVQLQISIVDDSFYPEDSSTAISIALIEEDYGFDQKVLYEIRFKRRTKEIISITKPRRKPAETGEYFKPFTSN